MIAIIAGTGSLPIETCKKLISQNKKFFVITLFPQNNKIAIEKETCGNYEVISQNVYKPSQIITLLKKKNAKKVLFIGKVDKSHLFKKIKFDWLAIKLLGSLICKSDKNIMEAILAELAQHNIKVINQDEILGGLIIPPGVLTGTLTQELTNDITTGLNAALEIAHANIGQTIVVKDGAILAVEAIEGTDQCIKRSLDIAHDGIVICKAARVDQNRKYDLPTLGPASIASFKQGQVKAVAWFSTHTLIAQKDLFVARAKQLEITLVSKELPAKNIGNFQEKGRCMTQRPTEHIS